MDINIANFDDVWEKKEYVPWFILCRDYNLSEDFIREFRDCIRWKDICKTQKLSEGLMRELQYYVKWDIVSQYQELSEDFMREFKTRIDWEYISKFQRLSEDFIREFQDKVYWRWILKYQKLSIKFRKEFNRIVIEDTWLYRQTRYKKQAIVESGLYECYDDYFIAYKGIRSDGFSYFTFRYKYEVGKVYISHADYTDEYHSFGLAVCTEDNTVMYQNDKLIKVKVFYKDIARIVNPKSIIRCSKLEVLEEVDKSSFK